MVLPDVEQVRQLAIALDPVGQTVPPTPAVSVKTIKIALNLEISIIII
jgi:hypothetical protein